MSTYPASSSTRFGHFKLYTIETGHFRMDGGAIFGVVPKPLWSRARSSDDKNRLALTARCLLIESEKTGRLYLVDCGNGHKFSEKLVQIYDIDYSTFTLLDSLSSFGYSPEDITDVIFTHMHFDHCGGAVGSGDGQKEVLTFPKARHWVHEKQWENVLQPNIREKASYLEENIRPVSESGLLHLTTDGHVFEDGLTILTVNGHSPGQQLPYLTCEGQTILFAADLLPTVHHLPLAWVMGFDTRPLITLEEKLRIFKECIDNDTFLFLEHDIEHELIQIKGAPERPEIAWKGTLSDL
ncbi:MBL fold metallo-hydrolase [Balneolaceae bacterium ANBcel3]|nr:MBL fold metallo-hydrolase [Balneolaceae bacterium ANBcel3]